MTKLDIPLIETCGEQLKVRLPKVADDLAARETADGNNLGRVSLESRQC
jgi:hypothetical protein